MTCDEDLPWTLDGEFGGKHKNVDIDVLAGRVNLVSPPSNYFLSEKVYEETEENVFAEEMMADTK